jgi:Asp-tRNA(Asn)/Glu-tRNA(Gln) amidotransferase A subunit family amidase
MPIGLQIVGRAFDETGTLRLGHAYQLATDWHVRRPPILQEFGSQNPVASGG